MCSSPFKEKIPRLMPLSCCPSRSFVSFTFTFCICFLFFYFRFQSLIASQPHPSSSHFDFTPGDYRVCSEAGDPLSVLTRCVALSTLTLFHVTLLPQTDPPSHAHRTVFLFIIGRQVIRCLAPYVVRLQGRESLSLLVHYTRTHSRVNIALWHCVK